MKKSLLLFALSFSCFLSSFASGGYSVEYKLSIGSTEGMGGNIKILGTADGNSRSEVKMQAPQMPGGGLNLVTLHKKEDPNTVYMIHDATKTYSKMDVSKYKNLGSASTDKAKYEVTVVGNEKVNNYNSVHVKIKRNGQQIQDMWLSKEVYAGAGVPDLSNTKYFPDNELVSALKAKGATGMPVRMVMEDHGNKMQMDLVKAENKDVAASLFTIPADYKEGGMLDGMMKEMGMPSQQELINMTPAQREQVMKALQQKLENAKH